MKKIKKEIYLLFWTFASFLLVAYVTKYVEKADHELMSFGFLTEGVVIDMTLGLGLLAAFSTYLAIKVYKSISFYPKKFALKEYIAVSVVVALVLGLQKLGVEVLFFWPLSLINVGDNILLLLVSVFLVVMYILGQLLVLYNLISFFVNRARANQ